jgi:MoxR-like ATPase
MTAAVRVRSVLDYMKSMFLEREDLIDGIGIALIAKKHIAIFGPPGTAKSLMTDAIAALSDLRYFSQQFSQFTSEDDTFGPKDIKQYRETGRFNRHCEGFLPTAEIYFADEIGKASHAVHDPLLKSLNERVYRNGDEVLELPLNSAIAASNEFFSDNPAFFDRFHLRYMVDSIKSPANFIRLMSQPVSLEDIKADPNAPKLLRADLLELQALAAQVTIPVHIIESMTRIRVALNEAGIYISDRRFRDAQAVLKATAVLQGRNTVEDDDLLLLQHMLWTESDEIKNVRDLIEKFASEATKGASKARMLVEEILSEMQSINKLSDQERTMRIATLDMRTRVIVKDMDAAIEDGNRNGRNVSALASVKNEADVLRKRLAAALLDGVAV